MSLPPATTSRHLRRRAQEAGSTRDVRHRPRLQQSHGNRRRRDRAVNDDGNEAKDESSDADDEENAPPGVPLNALADDLPDIDFDVDHAGDAAPAHGALAGAPAAHIVEPPAAGVAAALQANLAAALLANLAAAHAPIAELAPAHVHQVAQPLDQVFVEVAELAPAGAHDVAQAHDQGIVQDVLDLAYGVNANAGIDADAREAAAVIAEHLVADAPLAEPPLDAAGAGVQPPGVFRPFDARAVIKSV